MGPVQSTPNDTGKFNLAPDDPLGARDNRTPINGSASEMNTGEAPIYVPHRPATRGIASPSIPINTAMGSLRVGSLLIELELLTCGARLLTKHLISARFELSPRDDRRRLHPRAGRSRRPNNPTLRQHRRTKLPQQIPLQLS